MRVWLLRICRFIFFFSSRRRHTRFKCDWSSDVCSSDLIELYCGVGLFTLPLARQFKHVTGVESDAAAAEFARENLTNAGLQNAQVANRDVAEWLAMNVERGDSLSLSEKQGTIREFEKPVD